MKKKLSEILLVCDIFDSLTEKHYNNFSIAYSIAKASKDLNSQKEFYIKEERKIIEQYAVKDDNGQILVKDNRISFKDENDGKLFQEELIKLQSTEVDIFEPLEICQSDFKEGEFNITPKDIIRLEGFVTFKD